MTSVFVLSDGAWRALWRGRSAHTTFNSKGAALAWIASCTRAGKWRA